MPMDLIIAKKILPLPDSDPLPTPSSWERASAVAFCHDWRGENADPKRETQVRFLWSDEHLFVQFTCSYREVYVYEGGNCRRDELWMRDVAEIFIRPGKEDPGCYREFEISPSGHWLDLDINRGRKSVLNCGMRSRVRMDVEAKIWTAELALPFNCLASKPDPAESWRLNLFRIEGAEPRRFYSAWQPTCTDKPNFHVPEYFAELRCI
jgi:alpha-galactosidase